MLEVGLLEYISDARVLSRPSVEKESRRLHASVSLYTFWFYLFWIRSISCKLILYRAPYKVVVDTWAINSTYLFWGDIRGNYRLFIRLRAKKEKGKFILTCHFIIKYLPVERICCCLLVWLRFGGVILTDSETAPRQDRSVVTTIFGVQKWPIF